MNVIYSNKNKNQESSDIERSIDESIFSVDNVSLKFKTEEYLLDDIYDFKNMILNNDRNLEIESFVEDSLNDNIESLNSTVNFNFSLEEISQNNELSFIPIEVLDQLNLQEYRNDMIDNAIENNFVRKNEVIQQINELFKNLLKNYIKAYDLRKGRYTTYFNERVISYYRAINGIKRAAVITNISVKKIIRWVFLKVKDQRGKGRKIFSYFLEDIVYSAVIYYIKKNFRIPCQYKIQRKAKKFVNNAFKVPETWSRNFLREKSNSLSILSKE